MTDQYSTPPPGLPVGARAWAYLRDSGGSSQDRSVGQQEDEIKGYCKNYKFDLALVFPDVARSGGSTEGRDQFMRMIEMSEDESIRPQIILIWNFARFARDYNDSVFYKSTLQRRGIIVHSLTDQIPVDDFTGRIVETFINLTNEEKRRQTSRDVKRGLKALVSMGKGYAPGTPPRGYKSEPVEIGIKRDGKPRIVGMWIPDPVLSEYVKTAFEMRANGRTVKEIIKATNGKLYTTRSCFSTFFTNKTYVGYYGEIPDHHEPLITWELFETVQKLRLPRIASGINHPRRVGGPSLLGGIVYCMDCGGLMNYGWANKKNHWLFYMCGKKSRQGYAACPSKRIGAKNAEAQITAAILNQVLTPEYLSEVLEDTRKKFTSTDEAERRINAARRDLENLDIAIQRTLTVIEKTGSAAAQERLAQREAEKIQVKNEIQNLSAQLAAAQIEITPEAMEVIIQAWRDQFEEVREAGNIRDIKAWLMQFVTRIDLGYNKAQIHFTYPLDDIFNGVKQVNKLSVRGGTTLKNTADF